MQEEKQGEDTISLEILAKESNFAGYIAQKEVKGLSENSNAKPADILIKSLTTNVKLFPPIKKVNTAV